MSKTEKTERPKTRSAEIPKTTAETFLTKAAKIAAPETSPVVTTSTKKADTVEENTAATPASVEETVMPESGTDAMASPLKEESAAQSDAVKNIQVTTATVTIVPKKKAEFRSRRVQCVFQPSVYDKLKTDADKNGLSVNDLINQLVIAYLGNK